MWLKYTHYYQYRPLYTPAYKTQVNKLIDISYLCAIWTKIVTNIKCRKTFKYNIDKCVFKMIILSESVKNMACSNIYR